MLLLKFGLAPFFKPKLADGIEATGDAILMFDSAGQWTKSSWEYSFVCVILDRLAVAEFAKL